MRPGRINDPAARSRMNPLSARSASSRSWTVNRANASGIMSDRGNPQLRRAESGSDGASGVPGQPAVAGQPRQVRKIKDQEPGQIVARHSGVPAQMIRDEVERRRIAHVGADAELKRVAPQTAAQNSREQQ